MPIRAMLIASVLVFGCGGDEKRQPRDEKPESVLPEDAAPAPDAARRAPVPRQKVELDPEQRKQLRAHRAAGSKLQKSKKWAEAVREYEKALELDPSSDRLFSELSWVAFQAGDYQKAREAARTSVGLTGSPDLAAASLYNQGRAVEALGDFAKAKAIYAESLRLRPNEIVRKRLVALGGEPPVATSSRPPCATPAIEAELCACLEKVHEQGATCAQEGKPVDALRIWSVSYGTERTSYVSYYLVVESSAGLAVVGELARDVVSSPYVATDFRVAPIRKRVLGDHTLYEVETALDRHEDEEVLEQLSESSLTLCVSADGVPRCPLRIPVERTFAARAVDADEETLAEAARSYGARLPIERRHRLKVDVKADGKVEIALEQGARTAELKRYVGEHRLW